MATTKKYLYLVIRYCKKEIKRKLGKDNAAKYVRDIVECIERADVAFKTIQKMGENKYDKYQYRIWEALRSKANTAIN